MPVEPPPSRWVFPPTERADEYGIVGIGADLEPGTLLAAYRRGVFPMPIDGGDAIGWWSPNPRGVLELDELRVSRSLRQACRRFRCTANTDFAAVINQCAELPRDGSWITPAIVAAYTRLHHLGWAHSIEVWDETDRLVGGLYGVGVGRLFAGESMFHLARDASKVALVELVRRLQSAGTDLLDVQWCTDHLRTLGVGEIDRSDFVQRVVAATASSAVSDPGAIAIEMSR